MFGFEKAMWLFPVAVAVHNSEEALTMPAFDARHAGELVSRLSSVMRSLHLPYTAQPNAAEPFVAQLPSAATIRTALLVLTLAALVVTWLSARRGKQSLWAYLLFGGIVAMLANVFVPHIPAAIHFHGYAPGLFTAVVVNLPLMTWLSVRAVRDGWVAGAKAVAYGVAVPIALAGMILAWFAVVA